MTPRTSPPADNETALDRWVRDALADAYGGVADERLPDEWIGMLGEPPRE